MLLSFVFIQQRKQTELAHRAIQRKCKALNLQLLSVARGSYRLRLPNGTLRLHTQYHFDFSSLGDDCYTGELYMIGFTPHRFIIPPHRVIESTTE